jgi:hypothetical protein
MAYKQNQLLKAFHKAAHEVDVSLEKLALAFKACIDAGLDMSMHCEPSLAFRLSRIASGKLYAPTKLGLMLLEDRVVEALSTMTKAEQITLWEQGVKVVRREKTITIKPIDLRASEAYRVIDTTNGKGRVISVEEQMERAAPLPTPQKRDHIIATRFSYEEYKEILDYARREGKAPQDFVAGLVRAYLNPAAGAKKTKARATSLNT